MVFFTCDSCGESLKKNQVEKHYQFKCRSCSVLTCVDCQKDFPGDSYKEHYKCITEDEKYGGKNYTPKASANKGLKKQNAWIENLQDLVQAKSGELSGDVKSVVDTIITFENIPRKKPKFMNFVKNVLGGGKRCAPSTLEKTWDLLEQALKKKSEETKEAKKEELLKEAKNEEPDEVIEENADWDAPAKNNSDDDEERLGVKRFKGTKSVKDKSGNKRKRDDNQDSSKKKKAKNEPVDASLKKEESSDVEKDKSSIKKNKKESSAAKEKSGSSAKFDWEKSFLDVLEKRGGDEMKYKRLRKKVMKMYWDHVGSEEQLSQEEKEKLETKLEKKVKKCDKIVVDGDSVSLKTNIIITEDAPEDKGLKDEVAKVLDDLKNGKHQDDDDAENGQSFNQWESANLGDDKANEKFRRLMGLGKKSAVSNGGSFNGRSSHASSVANQDVKSMFSHQEDQYKRAIGGKRGIGLGFAEEQKKPQNKKIIFDD